MNRTSRLVALVASMLVFAAVVQSTCITPIKAPRLKAGNTVGLISPAGSYLTKYSTANYLAKMNTDMSSLGLKVTPGAHMSDQYGSYLAGTDENRAADINAFFANSTVQFILANRGGYGCDRLLHLVNYNAIKFNPKIIMGYSDLTALINAIHFKTGLITFYGPMGVDTWTNTDSTTNYNKFFFQQVAFNALAYSYSNVASFGSAVAIRGGKARGKLVGGNLSVFVSFLNSEYLNVDDWSQYILFLEEVGEPDYKVDRMLATLKIANILPNVAGVVWGSCNSCTNSGALTIDAIVTSYLQPLGVPAFRNTMIGHNLSAQFTLPIGAQVEIDADAGKITLLEPAVL